MAVALVDEGQSLMAERYESNKGSLDVTRSLTPTSEIPLPPLWIDVCSTSAGRISAAWLLKCNSIPTCCTSSTHPKRHALWLNRRIGNQGVKASCCC